MKSIETSRLLLRKFVKEDASMFFEVVSNDNVTRYMTNDSFTSITQTNRLMDYWIDLYKYPWNERYAIVLKENNYVIGYIDLVEYVDDTPEIGYALNEKYWNKGYMSEALEAFSNHLFSLGYQEVILGVVKENIGSSKVALKCGFHKYYEEERYLSDNKYYLVNLEWYKKKNPAYKDFIKLVKIRENNLDIAHKIENIIFPHYDAYNNYLDSFKPNSENVYWLLEVNGTYVGISGIYSYKKYPDDAWLGWFGLLEEYRGKHLGEQALALFEIYAKRRNFKYARLFTDRYDNDVAKSFYEAHGYKEEFYELDRDPASKIYPLSIYSKSLIDEDVPRWNNRDIHFTKQVRKQQ